MDKPNKREARELTLAEVEEAFDCRVSVIGASALDRNNGEAFICRHADILFEYALGRVHLLGFYANTSFAVLVSETIEGEGDIWRNEAIPQLEKDFGCMIEIVAANTPAFRLAETLLIERAKMFKQYYLHPDSFPCFISAREFAISVRSDKET